MAQAVRDTPDFQRVTVRYSDKREPQVTLASTYSSLPPPFGFPYRALVLRFGGLTTLATWGDVQRNVPPLHSQDFIVK